MSTEENDAPPPGGTGSTALSGGPFQGQTCRDGVEALGLDLEKMDKDKALDAMLDLRCHLTALDTRLRKTHPLDESRSSLERDRFRTFKLMQRIEELHQVNMYFSSAIMAPGPRTTPTSVSVSPSVSGDSQCSTRSKRALEPEPSAVGQVDWQVQGNCNKKGKTNKATKAENNPVRDRSISPNGMDTSSIPPPPPPKKPKIPPFFIIPPPGWHVLLSHIRNIAPSYSSVAKGKFLKISVSDEADYRAVQKYLLSHNINFKAFLLDEDRPLKVVIRGLPLNTDITQIKTALREENFTDLDIVQMYRGSVSNKKYMPLFLVNIPKFNNNYQDIFNVTDLFGTQVSFEVYRGHKGPTQCHNCQAFFHSSNACNLPARCLKCAGLHKTAECVKTYEEACKCANCGGDHPANFRNCPKFPKSSPPNKNKNNSNKSNLNNNSKKPPPPPASQARVFTSKMVTPSLSYAGIASGRRDAPPTPKTSQNSSVPEKSADSATDFINMILTFEKSYSPPRVLKALENALPSLREAHTEADRIFILYRAILECTVF